MQSFRHRPVFVVGCSRSGTTLVQSILGTSHELAVFPETNVLYHLADDLDYRRYGSTIGRRRIPAEIMKHLLNRIGVTLDFDWRHVRCNLPPPIKSSVPIERYTRRIFIRAVVRDFLELMDTASRGKRWVDKTPQNIFVIDFLERYITEAQFIHVLRDPTANVASIIDAANKYEVFRRRFGGENGLEKAVNYCRNARRISLSLRHSSSHHLVSYEDVASNTGETLRNLEEFLGLRSCSLRPEYRIEGIAFSNEKWKEGDGEIRLKKSKEEEVLTRTQVEYVRRCFSKEKS